jgi:hypothetical protein
MAGTIACYVCNTSATFDRQPLLFARYSSLHEGRGWDVAPTFRADRAGGRSHDWLSHDFRAVVSQGAQMAATSQRRRLSGKARRALELLVDRQGSTEAWMLDLGFTDRMLFLLAQAGLITIRHEIINTGAELIDIGRVRITDAGRQALEGMTARRPSPRLAAQ